MLNKAKLLELLNAPMSKSQILGVSAVLNIRGFQIRDLIDLTFNENKKIAFRAAWLLENIFLMHPQYYINDIGYLIESFNLITHGSCKRHYAKIAMHITSPKAKPFIKYVLSQTDIEPLLGKCFEWMMDPNVLVAVKSFAAEALFNLRHRYTWISEELPAILRILIQEGSAAIRNKGEKLLAYLYPLTYDGS